MNTDYKKRIFVEDQLAAEIIKKCLRPLGEGAMSQFEIVAFPGGAPSIFGKCITGLFQTGDTKSLFFLDGDQKPKIEIKNPADIPSDNYDEIKEQIFNLTGIKTLEFALDGGSDPSSNIKRYNLERKYLEYAIPRTFYLPSQNPEIFLWDNMPHDINSEKCDTLEPKERFTQLTKIEKGLCAFENVTSNDILETQIRKLALIKNDIKELSIISSTLREFVE